MTEKSSMHQSEHVIARIKGLMMDISNIPKMQLYPSTGNHSNQ